MTHLNKRIPVSFIILISVFTTYSQSYIYPLKNKPQLSANFGELRSNHFHSGIDLKTNATVNMPVYSIEKGYVSRINVSASGYGLALYVTHPTGHTSVYAHLNAFSHKIAAFIKAKQYEKESYEIDIPVPANELPVQKGEQIALSGNTGGSAGPHVHFEIRDTETEHALDALPFYVNQIPDTSRPSFQGIAVYPIDNKGIVNGYANPVRLPVNISKSGNQSVNTVNAWGKIGLGIKAVDRMNGQSNVFGVKNIRVYVDNNLIFSSTLNRFPFDKTRMLNTYTDFVNWKLRKSFYTLLYLEPGNTLPIYNKVANNGIIDINEERAYAIRYEIEDNNHNKNTLNFTINGKQGVISLTPSSDQFMMWNTDNSFLKMDMVLTIPANNLYNNLPFNYKRIDNNSYLSDIHQINNRPVPLHNSASLWIKLKTDNLPNKQNYGVVKLSSEGNNWIGGIYKNGGVEASIRELGDKYAVDYDNIYPSISPVSINTWAKTKKIIIQAKDTKSGISSFRGEIDGKFALFAHDMKSANYIYTFDERMGNPSGQSRQLKITVTDVAGNTIENSYEFVY